MPEAETWQVVVDTRVCIGSGGCEQFAPEDFVLDETINKSCPRNEMMAASAEILVAAENCPVEAISIRDCATGRMVFPPTR